MVSVATSRLEGFNQTFDNLKDAHGISTEVHWKKVDKGHGLINLAIDWLSHILRSNTARFDVIVVNTALYNKWRQRQPDREGAFYTTYTYLLRHLARQVAEHTEVLIDDRSDSYDKHTEVIETIGNSMLAQLQSSGRIANVRKARSHDHPGIQVADLLTGAVATGHRLYLDANVSVTYATRSPPESWELTTSSNTARWRKLRSGSAPWVTHSSKKVRFVASAQSR